MSIQGLSKISIYDPATQTVAQFNQVKGEGQLVVNPIDADPDSQGGIPYAGDLSELEAMVYDLGAAEDQVKSWMEDNTPVSAVGYGLQVNFYWFEQSRVRILKPNYFGSGQRRRATISMRKEGGIHTIDSVVNLLLNQPWSGNNKKIVYPIEGATLTLSQDTGQAMSIRALDASDTELESVSGSTSGGRDVATITLPAGTYSVECVLGAQNLDAALRSDGKTEYIAE